MGLLVCIAALQQIESESASDTESETPPSPPPKIPSIICVPNMPKASTPSTIGASTSVAAKTGNSDNTKDNTTVATPKTVLDKIVQAIRASPPAGSSGGVSRIAITKYLKAEFDYDNANQIKTALKRGVATGVLVQTGQSFVVAKDPPKAVPTPVGEPLQVEEIVKGKGSVTSEKGDTITVEYVGKLEDQTIFDSAKSFAFVLGAGDVIKGWDQGLVGMAKGAKRKLIVPSHLGYGKRGCAPDIPPNATLYFDVTMKSIAKPKDP